MVGLRFLVPSIGVRIPVRQRESETDRGRKMSVIQQLMLRTAHGHEPSHRGVLSPSDQGQITNLTIPLLHNC